MGMKDEEGIVFEAKGSGEELFMGKEAKEEDRLESSMKEFFNKFQEWKVEAFGEKKIEEKNEGKNSSVEEACEEEMCKFLAEKDEAFRRAADGVGVGRRVAERKGWHRSPMHVRACQEYKQGWLDPAMLSSEFLDLVIEGSNRVEAARARH